MYMLCLHEPALLLLAVMPLNDHKPGNGQLVKQIEPFQGAFLGLLSHISSLKSAA